MNTKLISQLTAASAITGAEKLELEQSSVSVYASVTGIMDAYGISSQAAIGSIQTAITGLASATSSLAVIIETVTTAVASYVKFGDNTMIMYKHSQVVSSPGSVGSTIVFPVSFITAPSITCTIFNTVDYTWFGAVSAGGCIIRCSNSSSTLASWTAIGKYA